MRALLVSLCVVASAGHAQWAEATAPRLALPRVGLAAQDLAVVINDADPASVELGAYYAQQRHISSDRIVHVNVPPGQATLSVAQFEAMQAALAAQTPASVQAYALAWTLPYRVECMSITSAVAFGFDSAYCADGCRPTRPSVYFDSASRMPFKDHGLRPAMLLAGKDLASAKAMIDRGVRSDLTWPDGVAYLLSTGDRKRNVRADGYDGVWSRLSRAYTIRRVEDNFVEDRDDVMFYFTGVQRVARLTSNRFLPGAMADHLTSLGGVLIDSPQTSVLEWLAAGATGSFGNTVEPCNYREKFPDIAVAMGRYLSGETLIEAYWKSVRMPGQGVFVGEPLARPFGGARTARVGQTMLLRTRALQPGRYVLQHAPSEFGPFRRVAEINILLAGVHEVPLRMDQGPFYRLVEKGATR